MSVSVEEYVKSYHHHGKQRPCHHNRALWSFAQLHYLGAYRCLLVAEADDNHADDEDYEDVERQHHEVHLLRGSRYNPQVKDARADAEDCSEGKRYVGGERRAAFPEHAHDEHCGHRRRYEAEHRLEYVKQVHALYVVYGYGYDYRNQRADYGDNLSRAHDFLLRGLRTDVLHVDVHREHRAEGVQGGAYRAD